MHASIIKSILFNCSSEQHILNSDDYVPNNIRANKNEISPIQHENETSFIQHIKINPNTRLNNRTHENLSVFSYLSQ